MASGIFFLLIGINIGMIHPLTLGSAIVSLIYGGFLHERKFYFPVGIVLAFRG
jgi:hypothetical protein